MPENTVLTGEAFGRPGMQPRWTSSSKNGVGTAYSASSRVWFTLSHGILNEIYFPYIDRPQVRDCQFLVTDGETFFQEEKRDLRHEIEYLDQPHALGYRITNSDREGRYRIVKEIIADPHAACVLVHTRLEATAHWLKKLKLYVLLAPHLEAGGWGNSARKLLCADQNILVAWKDRTHLALGTDAGGSGFLASSCGYVGTSDGWQDLHGNYQLDWQFDHAENGNVAVIGQIDLAKNNEFTLGIAFGRGQHVAVTTLLESLGQPFSNHKERFLDQWHRVCHGTKCLAPYIFGKHSGDEADLFLRSRALMLAHEDKLFAGALIASASIPWGQIKGDDDLGGYHLVWTRDMVKSATGLLACGMTATPQRALVYLACSQGREGGFPQNFWLDGTPYWTGVQLDEVAFPILLAWRLWKDDALSNFDPYPMVKHAAAYLVRHGPVTPQERWEENSGYSPSTLAAVIAGLICAADFARSRGETECAQFLEDSADFAESHVEKWTVTTQGSLVPGIQRHYIRIHPVDAHDCCPDEDPNHGMLPLRNQPPGQPRLYPAKDIVDAGFLELVRYGIRRPGEALMEDSLRVIDAILKVHTPYGPCWRRYNHDGYGSRPGGHPFEGWGKGRAWPLLTGERAHYELAAGRPIAEYIRAMEQFASKGGMLPEQVWDEPDCPKLRLGRPAGSAMPLMWAHAEYVELLRSAADSKVYDFIPIVAQRYFAGAGRQDLEVWSPTRQVRRVFTGQTLRIQMPAAFRLHWTANEWTAQNDTPSTSSGLDLHYLDIPIGPAQRAPIRFTFFWTAEARWDGRNYAVEVAPGRPAPAARLEVSTAVGAQAP